MTFEDSWIYLENHKIFKVRKEKRYKDFSIELQKILGDRDDDEIISCDHEVLESMINVSYCQIDRKVCVTLSQPMLSSRQVIRDLEKEIFVSEKETFEECIIELAKNLQKQG